MKVYSYGENVEYFYVLLKGSVQYYFPKSGKAFPTWIAATAFIEKNLNIVVNLKEDRLMKY